MNRNAAKADSDQPQLTPVPVNQLKRQLTAALEQAIAQSEFTSLMALWQQVSDTLEQIPEADRLVIAGIAIVQLAEILRLKSQHLLNDWEQRYSEGFDDIDPNFDTDLLSGLIQRTMHLDVSDLVRQPTLTKRTRKKPDQPNLSVAGVVEKTKLLQVVEQETAKSEALAVAHDEDISSWIQTIASWIELQDNQEIWFSNLCIALEQANPKMTRIKIFLGLLLGGFQLRQTGGFYDADIQICGSK